MKTTVVLEITHSKEIPDLAELAAQRAYTLGGGAVTDVQLGGWRPIETAPKDRGCLLGWVEGNSRFITWTKTSHVPLVGWCLADQGVEEFDLCTPTHWQPLPEPPK